MNLGKDTASKTTYRSAKRVISPLPSSRSPAMMFDKPQLSNSKLLGVEQPSGSNFNRQFTVNKAVANLQKVS